MIRVDTRALCARLTAALSVLACLGLPAPALAGDGHATVEDAIAAIEARFERRGYRRELLVNHAAAAASVGLELPPTQVLFLSSRRVESALVRREQQVAVDLPIRCLAYEDAGEVNTLCSEAGFLIDRHDLFVLDPTLYRLNRLLAPLGADDGLEVVESAQDFDATVASLLEVLEDRGFRVPAVIDFAQRAREVRRRLRPTTLVVFGNPLVGTPLMQASREIALDLPQKMLIFEDRGGRVSLVYNDPFFLASKHDVAGQDPRLGNIAAALAGIAGAAAGVSP